MELQSVAGADPSGFLQGWSNGVKMIFRKARRAKDIALKRVCLHESVQWRDQLWRTQAGRNSWMRRIGQFRYADMRRLNLKRSEIHIAREFDRASTSFRGELPICSSRPPCPREEFFPLK